MTDPAEYQEIFQARGNKYNAAMRLCPGARDEEAAPMLAWLGDPGDRFCDVPAGGGFLADQVHTRWPDTRICCVEPSENFGEEISRTYEVMHCPVTAIALPDRCMQSAGSLAGLHHLASKPAFFAEVHRVLEPGATFVVADVMEGTPPAAWLNEDVDELCPMGHAGDFLAGGELAGLLRDAGFHDVEERHRLFHWQFPDRDRMLRFNRQLFGLDVKIDVLERRLATKLPAVAADGKILQPWSLVYGRGRA